MVRIRMSPAFVDGWGELLHVAQEKSQQSLILAQKRVSTNENDG